MRATPYLSQLQENVKGQLKPSSPTKYHRLQASLWVDIEKMFDASLRPSAQEVLWQRKASTAKENPGKYTSLKVSQSIPIKEADKRLAEAIERLSPLLLLIQQVLHQVTMVRIPVLFFAWQRAQKIVNATQEEEMNDNWSELVAGIFQEIILDDLESLTRRYDALECLTVLKRKGLLPDSVELAKKIISKDAVFSPQGRANLLQGLDATD